MSVKMAPSSDAQISYDITKKQLKIMTAAFKKHPAGGNGPDGTPKETTSYALFPLANILDLLIANGIVNGQDTLEKVMAIKDHAIKVYFAQHVSTDDCPDGNEDYIGRNTVVMVLTSKNGEKWDDILNGDEENTISGESFGISDLLSAGTGSDKTNLCPPQC